jgi:hypothetical protein
MRAFFIMVLSFAFDAASSAALTAKDHLTAEPDLNGANQLAFMSMKSHPCRLARVYGDMSNRRRTTVKSDYTRRSARVQSLGTRPTAMNRMPAYLLAAVLAVAPLSAAAQDQGGRDGRPRREMQQERPRAGGGEASQRPSAGRPRTGGAPDQGGRSDDRRESQAERPRVDMGEAVQRASVGRPGRFLGARNSGDGVVVRWEYPGGRVADIMVDGRGRVIGER